MGGQLLVTARAHASSNKAEKPIKLLVKENKMNFTLFNLKRCHGFVINNNNIFHI